MGLGWAPREGGIWGLRWVACGAAAIRPGGIRALKTGKGDTTPSARPTAGGERRLAWRLAWWLAAWTMAVLCAGGVAVGHESDQFTVPVGKEFADLRLHFSEKFYDAACDVRDILNARIERSLHDGRATPATRRHQSPEAVARAMLGRFPPVIFHVETLELELRTPAVQDRHPGLLVAHLPAIWIYHHWALLLDLTKPMRLARSSTIMIDGVYLGTDKIVHFIHMGFLYHSSYRAARNGGADEADSLRRAVELGAGANPLLSENALLGMVTTGVRSNADLAANYAGLQFYRNLTEPVRVRGRIRSPMLIRDGEFWRLGDHVTPNSDFFTVFISDHWDEALNPNTYAPGMGRIVRRQVQDRCEDVLDWYRDDRGQVRTQREFALISDRLRTLFGDEYGYTGDADRVVSIANCCFDDRDPPTRPPPAPSTWTIDRRRSPDPKDDFERTPLWRAIRPGRLDEVRTLLAAGADVHAADVDGETALHCAARWGQASIAQLLLDHGASPDAPAAYGAAPLHLAVRRAQHDVMATLLANGATPSAQDDFGCTPLHDAASHGDRWAIALLLAAGASADVADKNGSTALHYAARAGRAEAAALLLDEGAGAEHRNHYGRRPADEADLAGDPQLAERLAHSTHATGRPHDPGEHVPPAEENELLSTTRRAGRAIQR